MRGQAKGTLKVLTNQNMLTKASILIRQSKDWTAFSAPLCLSAGTSPLYFGYEGAGNVDFQLF